MIKAQAQHSTPEENIDNFNAKLIIWIKDHYKILAGGIIALLVIIAVIVGVDSYLERRVIDAAKALAPGFTAYSELMAQPKLDMPAATAAAAKLEKVANEYGATPSGIQARLALGNLRFAMGEYDKALGVFSALCDDTELPAELLALCWHSKGACQEAAGKFADAASSYTTAGKFSGQGLAPSYTMDQARAYELSGDKAKALELYRTVASSNDQGLALMAKIEIARLTKPDA